MTQLLTMTTTHKFPPQVSHVLLLDEIFVVPNLWEFEPFGMAWDAFALLKRFHAHCQANRTSLTACQPMRLVIMMSQFKQDVSKNEMARFLAVVNALHEGDGSLSNSPAVKEFMLTGMKIYEL